MSSGESDEDTCESHEFYRDKPEWKDIEPVLEDDECEGSSVVSIDYSPEFRDVFDYFRAILEKNEKSERALALTTDAIKLNPANYTVWQYRREILRHLQKDLEDELIFIEETILKNPKNYQVWQHRRLLVEQLNDDRNEKMLTEKALHKDAKNYHAWQHRQWTLKKFGNFENEEEFIENLLDIDLRNNSAWNHRFFVNSRKFNDQDFIETDVDFTIEKIKKATENESAWNYLRGLIQFCGYTTKILEFCENLYASGCKSVFLYSMIIDVCDDELSKKNFEHPLYNLERGQKLCVELAESYDKMRVNYWKYLAEKLESRLKIDDAA